MKQSKYDVLAVGNAIVDIIARADDDFLVQENITKSAMNLIDAQRAEHLYSVMGPAVETSGGSAGNTAAGIASLGVKPLTLARWPAIIWVQYSPTIFVPSVWIMTQCH